MPGRLEAERSKIFTRRNTYQAAKNTIKVKRTETGNVGKVCQGQKFMKVGMHNLNSAFNGLHMSILSDLAPFIFPGTKGHCSHCMPSFYN
ncbi:hypothetical protein KSZ_37090 [Dictyobacter formicarum]|uniref:Transposase DDE domain-containing protein n=1 Tax=Dictyobacter formicarum TaxID=2778368 RepID=A0ABQ3VJC3_9CHLR|nr:hypothetical protein KSZ_37090 [Dictyobacter formicarum]